MGITLSMSQPLGVSAGTTDEVPHRFPVALAGRGYMLDDKSGGHKRRSIPLLRNQADTSDQAGEQSLSVEGVWRRHVESWHHGAGQTFLDRDGSVRQRFRKSKGVDVFNRWQLGLLPDTEQARASANTNLRLAVAGSRLYMLDGGSIVYTTDLATFSDITGEPATAANGIASDGFNVYTGHGANGIFKTDRNSTATAVYNSRAANGIVAYVKGRLIVSNNNQVVNVTGGAAETNLLTHRNTDFRWVGAAESANHILIAGFSGDKSEIYRTAIKDDASALDVLVVAGTLPDGEVVYSIDGYINYVVLGTSKGVRFCTVDGNGNLTIGPIIPTDHPVRCFEGQDRFVWYGLTNYDGTSTGLGRLDLRTFNDEAPAYASDLMATGQGNVLSVVTFLDKRVFTVSGLGVYRQSNNKVPSGTVESGFITYGIPDRKVAMKVDLRHDPLDGSVAVAINPDQEGYSTVATSDAADSNGNTFSVGEISAERFEVRLTLNRDATDLTEGPVVTRETLHARPAPDRGRHFFVPLLVHEKEKDRQGNPFTLDVAAVVAEIERLTEDGRPVTYQEGTQAYSVTVEDFEFSPYNLTHDGKAFNGTMTVKLALVTG